MKELLEDDKYKEIQCIYKITNEKTGKAYIGSTKDLKHRMKSHISKLENIKHSNKELQKDWNIYELKNFSFEVLEIVELKSKLPIKEKEYIDQYKKLNGVYNKSDPTEEFWQSRYSDKEKKKKKGNNKLSKPYIKGFLEGKFGERIRPIKDKLRYELYIDSEIINVFTISEINNDDILNHSSLESVINNWYRDHEIGLLKFPNYKKEFKQLYGTTVEDEKNYFVSLNVYDEILKKRKRNMMEFKASIEEVRKEEAKTKPPKKIKVTKERIPKEKPKKSKETLSDEEKIQIGMLKEQYKLILPIEFEHLLSALSEKINSGSIVSYEKVFQYILDKISLSELNENILEREFQNLVRSEYNASIFNFESVIYNEKILNKFKIDKRERKIMSREKGKEIMKFKKELS